MINLLSEEENSQRIKIVLAHALNSSSVADAIELLTEIIEDLSYEDFHSWFVLERNVLSKLSANLYMLCWVDEIKDLNIDPLKGQKLLDYFKRSIDSIS